MATVDIVMRTKNRPLFLARALDDVLAQRFTDWHLHVVDDGGDAQITRRLIEERGFGDQCTLLALPTSEGMAASGNKGAKAGTAAFLTFHDDNDTWHPEFLARTVEHLQTTADVAVTTRIDIVWEKRDGDRLVKPGHEHFHPLMQEVTYFDLLRYNHMVPIGILIRRTAWDEHGPLDESLERVEDWVLNMSLARTGRYGVVDEVLAYWHQRPDSEGDEANSVIDDRMGQIRNDRRLRDRAVREYVEQHGPGGLLYLAK